MPVHPVKEFVRRISSKDLDEYPNWDLSRPLPKLRVPDLHSTLHTYLKLIEPVVSEEALNKTRKHVMKFLEAGGDGEKIQKKLQELAKTKDNWVSDWWLQDMYLNNPLPLPVNSNPGLVFPRTSFECERVQLRFAAQLITGILDYKTILDARGLPMERARHHKKGQPLCMEQYYRLFSSHRNPGKVKDVQLVNLTRDPFDPEYVIVACRDQFFIMNVTRNGMRLSEEDIYNQLRRICKEAEESCHDPRIGILTSMRRPIWAEAHEHLMLNERNRKNLEFFEQAAFILCLDQPIDVSFNHETSQKDTKAGVRDDTNRSLQLLHGMGSKHNGANRWYDKTMQFVISRDGNTGLNYEHSVSEGIAVINLIEHIMAYMEEMKQKRLQRFPSICELPHPQKIIWEVDETINFYIDQGLVEIDKLVDDLDLYILRFDKFGREFPKTVNMSPDSFVQLALQLAHYKVHKYLVPTYESASIRRFHLGRVDVIHSASIPALEWVKAMVDESGTVTNEQRVQLLRAAIEWQTEHMLQTILGHGVDNHMLGLRKTAETMDVPYPDIFQDSVYVESQQFRLSTSQVSTTTDALICYGAVVSNGYGAAYNLHKNNIVVCISCWKHCPNPDISSLNYGLALKESFEEMYDICSANIELTKVCNINSSIKIPEENKVNENGEFETEELKS